MIQWAKIVSSIDILFETLIIVIYAGLAGIAGGWQSQKVRAGDLLAPWLLGISIIFVAIGWAMTAKYGRAPLLVLSASWDVSYTLGYMTTLYILGERLGFWQMWGFAYSIIGLVLLQIG